MTSRKNAVLYVILSTIGAIFLVVIVMFSEAGEISFLDKLIVGGAFIVSCLLGISLAIRPGWIRGSSRTSGHTEVRDEEEFFQTKWIGHHPDCEKFKGHVIRIGKRTLCSGCTGLALGAVFAIVLLMPYLFLPARAPPEILTNLFFAGLALVAFSYIDIAFSVGGGRYHGDFNFFLVVGFYFVVIGVHQLSGSVAFGLIAIIVSFLWLDTRIQLSRWRHVDTCARCSEPCKAY